jgi:hypothetical protein
LYRMFDAVRWGDRGQGVTAEVGQRGGGRVPLRRP